MNDSEQIADNIEDVNPWTDILVKPRQTIDWIVDNYSSLPIAIFLIYLGGVHFGIGQAEMKDYGDRKTIGEILTASIFISGIGGLITYHLWIGAIDLCASLFGGKGNFRKTQTAFAWAMLPMIAGLILTLVGYILFEEELFTSEAPNINSSSFLITSFWIYRALEIALGIWHTVLLVATISQVQKLTVIKSIACIFGGFLLLTLPVIGIVFLMR